MKTEHESSGDTVVDSLTSQMRLHSEGDESVLAVIDKIVSRSKAGQSKYGVTLERQDLTRLQWLTHAQEEAIFGKLFASFDHAGRSRVSNSIQ